jgi:hypothetical protein
MRTNVQWERLGAENIRTFGRRRGIFRLAFLVMKIEDQELIHRRKLEKLGNDLRSVEKQKRQFERRQKSGHQAIDDEYERNITVAQGQLRQKIENNKAVRRVSDQSSEESK